MLLKNQIILGSIMTPPNILNIWPPLVEYLLRARHSQESMFSRRGRHTGGSGKAQDHALGTLPRGQRDYATPRVGEQEGGWPRPAEPASSLGVLIPDMSRTAAPWCDNINRLNTAELSFKKKK